MSASFSLIDSALKNQRGGSTFNGVRGEGGGVQGEGLDE